MFSERRCAVTITSSRLSDWAEDPGACWACAPTVANIEMAPRAHPPARAMGQADLADGARLLSERFVIGIPSQSHSLGARRITNAASNILLFIVPTRCCPNTNNKAPSGWMISQSRVLLPGRQCTCVRIGVQWL